jgi:uncharacterized protein (DUF2164 family)
LTQSYLNKRRKARMVGRMDWKKRERNVEVGIRDSETSQQHV